MENLIFLAAAVFVLLSCVTVIIASLMLVKIAKTQSGAIWAYRRRNTVPDMAGAITGNLLPVFEGDETVSDGDEEADDGEQEADAAKPDEEPVVKETPEVAAGPPIVEVDNANSRKKTKTGWKSMFRNKKAEQAEPEPVAVLAEDVEPSEPEPVPLEDTEQAKCETAYEENAIDPSTYDAFEYEEEE